MTDSMRSFLQGIAPQSTVALYLLGSKQFTDYGDFLAIRRKDNTPMISFCPKGKQQEFNEQGDYSRKNRQEGTPARVAQKLIGDGVFTNGEYELFSNLFVGGTNMDVEFHVGDTLEDFQFAYLEDHYILTHTGSLWNSCMRHERCQNYFNFYVKVNARILYATINNRVVARAILWTLDDGDLLLDRVYGYNDAIKYSMLDYAKKELRIKYFKQHDSYDTPTCLVQIMEDGAEMECIKSLRLTLTSAFDRDDSVPYMDTFKYCDGDYLYNCASESYGGTERYILTNTDSTFDTEFRCHHCGEWVAEGSEYWLDDDHPYCDSCVVTDEVTGRYILEKDAVEAYNEHGILVTTHINNATLLVDGSYGLNDCVVYDDYNDDGYILERDSDVYCSVVDGVVESYTTLWDTLEDTDEFARIKGEYYLIETCQGNVIEEIDDEWYLIGSEEWKEAKSSQVTEDEQENNEEVA